MTHTHATPSARAETFLRCLGAEEELLAASAAKADEVYAALRRGDLAGVAVLGGEQEQLAAALRRASGARLAATPEPAPARGAEPLTLADIADRLPEPHGGEVRAARGRLADLASRLTAIQTRNANLIGHLRSFFRDVLADLAADGTPARYGPTGQLLPGAYHPRRGTA